MKTAILDCGCTVISEKPEHAEIERGSDCHELHMIVEAEDGTWWNKTTVTEQIFMKEMS